MWRVLVLAATILLAGCQTIPLSNLSAKSDDGNARVVIRPFYVPLGANFLAGFMGGGMSPFGISVYDVTSEPKYLGFLWSGGVIASVVQEVFEYDTTPGNKVLMLHRRTPMGGDYVDFVEFSVASNRTEHVAISQYGMMDRPYFRKIELEEAATRHCGQTKGLTLKDALAYRTAQGFGESKYAAAYCVALSSHSIVKRAPVAVPPPAITTARAKELQDRYLPIWRRMADKVPPYDIE